MIKPGQSLFFVYRSWMVIAYYLDVILPYCAFIFTTLGGQCEEARFEAGLLVYLQW